jgi:hypothetical protein
VKRLLLDEHIPPLYRVQLRRRDPGLTIWQIGDEGAPARGTSDPEILTWCEANDFVLVTNNRRTMARHLADHLATGRHVPGIWLLDLDAPVSLAIEDLWIAAVATHAEEFQDTIIYIPLG